MQESGFSDQQIDRFRAHQRTAFSIQADVVAQLVSGMTEKDVARQLMLRPQRCAAGNGCR